MAQPIDPGIKAAALVMLAKGQGPQAVATALGLSRQTVWRWQKGATVSTGLADADLADLGALREYAGGGLPDMSTYRGCGAALLTVAATAVPGALARGDRRHLDLFERCLSRAAEMFARG